MKQLKVTVNGKVYDVAVEEVSTDTPIVNAAEPSNTPKPAATEIASGQTAVKSPMPGTVLDIKVTAGQSVKKGDVLMVLEAMKMENDISAPQDGTINAVKVSKGESVESDQLLFVIG